MDAPSVSGGTVPDAAGGHVHPAYTGETLVVRFGPHRALFSCLAKRGFCATCTAVPLMILDMLVVSLCSASFRAPLLLERAPTNVRNCCRLDSGVIPGQVLARHLSSPHCHVRYS